MVICKKVKDQIIKVFLGDSTVPRGLFELGEYFRLYGSINFEHQKGDGVIIAKSTNFRYGSIVTSGKDEKELDKNIKDAILTSFQLPSSYSKEAKICKVGEKQLEYALV